jgi:NAD(P)H-hydrate epimerase
VLGTCIRATLTVTFGLPKTGLLVQPGKQHAGNLVVADISIPPAAIRDEPIRNHLIEGQEFSQYLPPKKPEAHKGDFGHLLALSGSPGKTGAAALLCQAAVRTGTGLVTLGIPQSLNIILEVKITEAMTEPLPETKDQTLAFKARNRIRDLLAKKTAMAVGPGLSLNPETARLIRKIVLETDLPMVVDADGLIAFAGHMDLIRRGKKKGSIVLTPHPGEMAKLLQCRLQQIQQDRVGVARDFAQTYGQVLILKGADSLVADPGGMVFINPTGNPGMATGGMGDVLTGMVGGFLAQGFTPLAAAKLGVFLHGLAGDWVAHQKGERGMAATDLIEGIPRLLQALARQSGQVDDFSFPLRVEMADLAP